MCSSKTVIACNLAALDRAEQRRRADLAAAVSGRAGAVVETEDGYTLRLNTADIAETIEWIGLERRCCPFVRFTLEWKDDDSVWVRLEGGPGVREAIAAEMGFEGPR